MLQKCIIIHLLLTIILREKTSTNSNNNDNNNYIIYKARSSKKEKKKKKKRREKRMTARVLKQDPNTKGSKERLFITTRTHNMQIFGEIPFVKPHNDTSTTAKGLNTMKNESETFFFFFG